MATVLTEQSPTQRAHDIVRAAGFRQDSDGWFYPTDKDRSLVRIAIGADTYEICRRRKLTTGWIPIVHTSIHDFQPEAFAAWRATWPLSC